MTVEISVLAAQATPFATFHSANQKIASNRNGTMAGFITARNADYTNQRVEVWFWPDEEAPPVKVWSADGQINPPAIEAAETGEFYAVSTSAAMTYIAYWADIRANPVPVIRVIGAPLGGKYAALFDEGRRRLLIFGNQYGALYGCNDQGVLETAQVVSAATALAQLEYPILSRTDDGMVHLYWTSYQLGTDPVNYRAVGALWSPDTAHWAPMTAGCPWVGAPWIAAPGVPFGPDEGSSSSVVRSEDAPWNKLLSAAFSDDQHTHLIFSLAPTHGAKLLASGGARTSMVHKRYDRRTGRFDFTRWPLRTVEGARPYFPGSFLTRRGGNLHHLFIEGRDIVETVSADAGESWTIRDRHSLDPVAFPAPSFVHFLTGKRGRSTDDHIEVMATVVEGTTDLWIAGALDMAPAKVVRLKLYI